METYSSCLTDNLLNSLLKQLHACQLQNLAHQSHQRVSHIIFRILCTTLFIYFGISHKPFRIKSCKCRNVDTVIVLQAKWVPGIHFKALSAEKLRERIKWRFCTVVIHRVITPKLPEFRISLIVRLSLFEKANWLYSESGRTSWQ